ncbi:phosphate ABC transporter substrate-binding protein PstS [Leucobacter sp. OLJS4]|uniref:phosphate ABC transporter substrate-binding protein PstS n=1 Tax=unclassified Leucobacter TaxID=2621730 RepID=UPI000C18EA93|nr:MULTISPECIES: phosphate ABC transporter substrate-binding protein PstS [unclassified Leucobacter]PII84526.1 phosphate ABC transporter substrate-binding protein PstS [Leucobacter sp. OLCALW19]PII88764.1 phosphate ABC transporter substrate-binding protein PstS [Leucobacter sp. OLTLW20]PII90878.1 phosphate ABC transporter substrate-binding protein PstS [Leucobacter sp. OLAS13]PII97625.1 phosphate ABC transporter substrate-binding protein PstS [Leucobacter sp. OLDS2]PII98914.1 phosphate ABC tra
MKISPAIKIAAIGGIAAIALTSCAANESGGTTPSESASKSNLSGELNGAGASSQDSAQQAWIAAFQQANDKVTINYEPSGSGAGRETFQQGASAFAGSDRAFKAEEIKAGPFKGCAPDTGIVEVPAYISPIAIIFNVEGVDSLKLDAPTVAKIFSGKITKWNDQAIASQNPDAKLPDTNITAVHRSDKSGTTGNFTDYLAAAGGADWAAGSVEEWPKELGGEGASGTSGVVQAVTKGVGTIGYADASKAGKLGTVEIKVGDKYVKYSPEAASAIAEHSELETGRTANDLAVKIDRTSDKEGVYPIVLISYLIGCEQYADAKNAELVKSYFGYVTGEEGQKAAAEASGSAPLPSALAAKVKTAVDAIK